MERAPESAREPDWKRRFRAPRVMFPSWARDDADRLLFLSNEGGKFEVHTWDRRTGEKKRLTDRSEGTGYRVPARLEPSGKRVWWFDDAKGNELGRWVRVAFEGGMPEPMTPDLAQSYSAGLAIGNDLAVIGRSSGTEGATVHVRRGDGALRRIYAHKQSASVGDLSRDETYFALWHSEHGDSRNRAIRVLDLEGRTIAEKWDGAGRGLHVFRWAPVAGDQRIIVGHERTGIERPIIWDVTNDTEIALDFELPGEVAADWYPDARALLIDHDHRGRTELYRYDLASKRLEKLSTERGTIGASRVRPDGEVWYMLDRSSEQPLVRSVSGDIVLRPSGEPAPRGASYRDADVDGIHVFVAEPPGGSRGAQPPAGRPSSFFIHGVTVAHPSDSYAQLVQAYVARAR